MFAMPVFAPLPIVLFSPAFQRLLVEAWPTPG
jgi:hypothetical protein